MFQSLALMLVMWVALSRQPRMPRLVALLERTARGALSGIKNTYYPGTASIAAGTKRVDEPGRVERSYHADSWGDLLLVIQMQDASINTTNTTAMGPITAPAPDTRQPITPGNTSTSGPQVRFPLAEARSLSWVRVSMPGSSTLIRMLPGQQSRRRPSTGFK